MKKLAEEVTTDKKAFGEGATSKFGYDLPL